MAPAPEPHPRAAALMLGREAQAGSTVWPPAAWQTQRGRVTELGSGRRPAPSRAALSGVCVWRPRQRAAQAGLCRHLGQLLPGPEDANPTPWTPEPASWITGSLTESTQKQGSPRRQQCPFLLARTPPSGNSPPPASPTAQSGLGCPLPAPATPRRWAHVCTQPYALASRLPSRPNAEHEAPGVRGPARGRRAGGAHHRPARDGGWRGQVCRLTEEDSIQSPKRTCWRSLTLPAMNRDAPGPCQLPASPASL